jgi:hypothetical protein
MLLSGSKFMILELKNVSNDYENCCCFHQYMEEITQSVILSRRLAHFSAKKIAQLCNESDCMPPRTDSPMLTSGTTG